MAESAIIGKKRNYRQLAMCIANRQHAALHKYYAATQGILTNL
ncbi:hypothetical protein [Mesorhizobium intechi]|nr:hypothetical protein [Mesorhizobium intechi]